MIFFQVNSLLGHSSLTTGSTFLEETVALLLGALLFLLTIPLIWLNERRYLITSQRISTSEENCQTTSSSVVNSDINMSLVHVIGETKTERLVTDPVFNVNEANIIKFVRQVEMYQWVKQECQDSSRFSNRNHYNYSGEWKSDNQFSVNQDYQFHQQDSWVVNSQVFLNSDVRLGAYVLNDSLKIQTMAKIPVQLTLEHIAYFKENPQYQSHSDVFEEAGYLYLQQNEQLSVGDLRVRLFKELCGTHTIIAQQFNNTFQPFTINDANERLSVQESQHRGCWSKLKCYELLIKKIDWIYESNLCKTEIFKLKLQEAKQSAYIARFGYSLCIFFAQNLVLYNSDIHLQIPNFSQSNSILNLLSQILVSIAISLSLLILAISFVWLYYRPITGGLLLSIAVVSSLGAGSLVNFT